LKDKLSINNLEFKGSCVPSNPNAVPEAISTLVSGLKSGGAVDLIVPKRPISFTNLVKALKELQLISLNPPLQPRLLGQPLLFLKPTRPWYNL
jgi:hypothetical protein